MSLGPLDPVLATPPQILVERHSAIAPLIVPMKCAYPPWRFRRACRPVALANKVIRQRIPAVLIGRAIQRYFGQRQQDLRLRPVVERVRRKEPPPAAPERE